MHATSPSAQSDRQCAECPAGSFSRGVNATHCAPWTECGPGYRATGGTATSDVTCEDVDGCAQAGGNPCDDHGDPGGHCVDAAAPADGHFCQCSTGFVEQDGACIAVRDTSPVFMDDFESGLGRWDTVEGTWATQGVSGSQVPGHGSGNAVANGAGCDDCGLLSPVLHTAGAIELTLTVYRFVESSLDSDDGEYLDLWVRSSGQWTRVERWAPPDDDDDHWHFENIDLTAFASNDLQIGFWAKSNSSSEDVEIDDLTVTMTR